MTADTNVSWSNWQLISPTVVRSITAHLNEFHVDKQAGRQTDEWTVGWTDHKKSSTFGLASPTTSWLVGCQSVCSSFTLGICLPGHEVQLCKILTKMLTRMKVVVLFYVRMSVCVCVCVYTYAKMEKIWNLVSFHAELFPCQQRTH